MNVLGLGTDLVDMKKLKKKLSGKYGKRFIENTFTENEICCARGKNFAKFATAFAAKEAVYKAFRTGWIEGKDVEVLRDPGTGEPSILLHGEIHKIAKKRKVKKVHVSLSFTEAHAVAVALLTS
jgi:holo-[acyl-carrier protein] synthase